MNLEIGKIKSQTGRRRGRVGKSRQCGIVTQRVAANARQGIAVISPCQGALKPFDFRCIKVLLRPPYVGESQAVRNWF